MILYDVRFTNYLLTSGSSQYGGQLADLLLCLGDLQQTKFPASDYPHHYHPFSKQGTWLPRPSMCIQNRLCVYPIISLRCRFVGVKTKGQTVYSSVKSRPKGRDFGLVLPLDDQQMQLGYQGKLPAHYPWKQIVCCFLNAVFLRRGNYLDRR